MNIIKTILNYLNYYLLKLFFKHPIKVYYWKESVNFGDLLTPELLKIFGYTPLFFYPHRAQLVCTGSLIEHITADYKGLILGTGIIDKNTDIKFQYANIIGVRGEKTKQKLEINENITLGDPGLLALNLLNKRSIKKYKLGIIPHYADKENNIIKQIHKRYPKDTTIIDVQDTPQQVLEKIDECEHVLSSSLHGLICSDALGIPNKWIKLSDLLGGDFKFEDYYSVFNISPKPIILSGKETLAELISYTETIPPEKVEMIKDDLENAFKQLKNHF